MNFNEAAILSTTRPKDSLLTYYVLVALTSLVAAPIMGLYLYFRYHTMRYKFDKEGISMSWGILFHHEIVLNYSRIQDIHLRSNFIERMLGLARLEVQTASAGAGAEMTLEGLENVEEVRDFLYSRMRGAKHTPPALPQQSTAQGVPSPELAGVLHEIAAELRTIRQTLEASRK
jgi:membrane protein YdbS with pleckstrin-like domain